MDQLDQVSLNLLLTFMVDVYVQGCPTIKRSWFSAGCLHIFIFKLECLILFSLLLSFVYLCWGNIHLKWNEKWKFITCAFFMIYDLFTKMRNNLKRPETNYNKQATTWKDLYNVERPETTFRGPETTWNDLKQPTTSKKWHETTWNDL